MDINLEFNIINTFLENKFEFIHIHEHNHLFCFELSYLEKNLFYLKIWNKDKKPWKEDVKLKVYSIDETKSEDFSIGSCDNDKKEIEFYCDIDLFKKEEIIKYNIPNNIFISKSFEITNKKNYYDLLYFFYQNKFYSFHNNFENIETFFRENYQDVLNLLEYIINKNLLLTIKVLYYLNKHGGIFINDNLKYLSIDKLNKDTNICYINNNTISILFCKINFLNEELFLEDLKNKNELNFSKYLNDFEIINNEPIVNELNLKTNNDYYNNIIHYNDYVFYIMSKNNEKYNIEKLPNNYYCLTNNNEIENDIHVEIYNKSVDTRFKLDDKYIKNKFNNNIIFKL